MKRLSRRSLLLFVLPFILLAGTIVYLNTTVKMETDNRLFAQEVARKIPLGTPVDQAEAFLKSSGFSSWIAPSPTALSKSSLSSPKRLGFVQARSEFPNVLDQHVWKVTMVVQNNRVQKIHTSVEQRNTG